MKLFHANVQYERNIIAPWPLCTYIKENVCSSATRRENDMIVISDSDDDKDVDASACERKSFLSLILFYRWFI